MIHHQLKGVSEPRRRIAVIQIPRAQRSRLGIIRTEDWIAGPNTSALNSWAPVSDLASTLIANGSSVTPEQWMATILQAQSAAGEQTPGTLSYTPAPANPSGATIEGPWASWQTSDCDPDSGSALSVGVPSPAAAAAAAAPSIPGISPIDNNFYLIAGVIGAAASLVYLKNASKRRTSA
jgi:hypothetical protein